MPPMPAEIRPTAAAVKRSFMILAPSDGKMIGALVEQVVNHAVDVEVQQDRRLVAVHEITHPRVGDVIEDAEVDVVIAGTTENPAHHGAGAGVLDPESLVHLVQEHVPTGLQQLVEVTLLRL